MFQGPTPLGIEALDVCPPLPITAVLIMLHPRSDAGPHRRQAFPFFHSKGIFCTVRCPAFCPFSIQSLAVPYQPSPQAVLRLKGCSVVCGGDPGLGHCCDRAGTVSEQRSGGCVWQGTDGNGSMAALYLAPLKDLLSLPIRSAADRMQNPILAGRKQQSRGKQPPKIWMNTERCSR